MGSHHDESRIGRSSSKEFNPHELAVLAGLVAGLLGFGLGEMSYETFPPQRVPHNIQGSTVLLPSLETQLIATTKTSALVFGEFGAMLGLCLGLAGGLARRSAGAAGVAGLLGMAAGAIVGALVSFGVVPLFFAAFHQAETRKLELALLMHGLIAGVLGIVAGLAFAVGLGRRKTIGKVMVCGLIGAILAVVAADLIGALFFPMDGTDEPISSSWHTRLLARGLVAIAVGVAIALALPSSQADSEATGNSNPEPAPAAP